MKLIFAFPLINQRLKKRNLKLIKLRKTQALKYKKLKISHKIGCNFLIK